ncbi:hypothetical protein LCGC14_1084990 [marine sediment metagenome]|uniref:Uncharacterized protein n=1 Tax=marine sediment metagenome TaxID=412755 RepID=A0A0F9PX81_9ZZZZ
MSTPHILSDGSPPTLGTYLKYAEAVFGDKAAAFIQKKIDSSPNGEDEIVIVDERLMIQLLGSIM